MPQNLTKIFEKIWDKYHNPDEQEKEKIKEKRRKRKEEAKKDWGLE